MNTRSKTKEANDRHLSDGNGSIATDASDTHFPVVNGSACSTTYEKLGTYRSKYLVNLGR